MHSTDTLVGYTSLSNILYYVFSGVHRVACSTWLEVNRIMPIKDYQTFKPCSHARRAWYQSLSCCPWCALSHFHNDCIIVLRLLPYVSISTIPILLSVAILTVHIDGLVLTRDTVVLHQAIGMIIIWTNYKSFCCNKTMLHSGYVVGFCVARMLRWLQSRIYSIKNNRQ